MGRHGKHIISPMEVMVDLKHSALSNSHVIGRHLQAPQVPLAPPDYNPDIQRTASTSPAPALHPNAAVRHSISLPTKQFQLAAELQRIHGVGIADSPPVIDISYDEYHTDDETEKS